MEAEVTGKLLRRGIRPYEIPISYKARTREAGKKLDLARRARGIVDPAPRAIGPAASVSLCA